ncbi:MAG: hypothetical protein A7316_00995 [Candidatus Altiarchaeales archaeon WOR_SM1_86-2]|nr:MAG: hypothetical protein A7315_12345 [Candidatus Altiarchaeales archaeon WOR_SM1_79]ODS38535.1 MAG: hypothetical protein A7316_00995 [Candidatus Altiarchaeales archaeon WOR_SM1_86-2]
MLAKKIDKKETKSPVVEIVHDPDESEDMINKHRLPGEICYYNPPLTFADKESGFKKFWMGYFINDKVPKIKYIIDGSKEDRWEKIESYISKLGDDAKNKIWGPKVLDNAPGWGFAILGADRNDKLAKIWLLDADKDSQNHPPIVFYVKNDRIIDHLYLLFINQYNALPDKKN